MEDCAGDQAGDAAESGQDTLSKAVPHRRPIRVHAAGDEVVGFGHAQPQTGRLGAPRQADVFQHTVPHSRVAANPAVGPPPEGDALSVGRGQESEGRMVDAQNGQIGVDRESHERNA